VLKLTGARLFHRFIATVSYKIILEEDISKGPASISHDCQHNLVLWYIVKLLLCLRQVH
jgi:hypothetical protein